MALGVNSAIEILEARGCGDIRACVVLEHSENMDAVLGKFGLLPNAKSLIEISRAAAHSVVESLIAKDMAYGYELMPRAQAKSFTRSYFCNFPEPQSQFFSNRASPESESWSPMTESTFDSGIVVKFGEGLYACLWFEDED